MIITQSYADSKKGEEMNAKNPHIAPINGTSISETEYSYVNLEAIASWEEIRLALELLKVITENPISYASAEIALDYAKQLLDNMIISDSKKVIKKFEELINGNN